MYVLSGCKVKHSQHTQVHCPIQHATHPFDHYNQRYTVFANIYENALIKGEYMIECYSTDLECNNCGRLFFKSLIWYKHNLILRHLIKYDLTTLSNLKCCNIGRFYQEFVFPILKVKTGW